MPLVGDPAPRFVADSSTRKAHSFDVQAGRYLVLSFVGRERLAEPGAIAALAGTALSRTHPVQHWFVLAEAPAAAGEAEAPIRYLLDPQGAVARLYGLAPDTGMTSFVLTPRLHVAAIVAAADLDSQVRGIEDALAAQPLPADLPRVAGPAPVLIIPGVFEPEFCRLLVDGYARYGGEASHFARDENGRTVQRLDSGFKVRRDWRIEQPAIHRQIEARFVRRVVPEIRRAYQFAAERIERHLVACYDAAEGGHFAAHRDDTARGTEHRRFACSLNLNDDYEGGTLIFPEFGMQQYRPAAGACVIFSASLLHQANRVTSGRRFAYLPFLHDEAAEAIFQRNRQFIDEAPAAG